MSEISQDNAVEQTGNLVRGDQAGRDVNKPTYIYQGTATPMARMIAKFRLETAQDREIKLAIERLQRWFRSEGDVIGLDEKLRLGERSDIILLATEAKQRFAQCLMRHEYSPAAQEIYAFLLAKTYQIFVSIIRPQICRGVAPKDIDQLLVTEIYDKVEALLEDNPLDISPEEVMGMLYWLTGNCHLKWSKDANI